MLNDMLNSVNKTDVLLAIEILNNNSDLAYGNLKVGGDLYLRNTPITSLPDGLQVGGYLYLRDTPITSLPDNLQVGGDLYLRDTPLAKKYTKDQIKQMIKDKGGNVKGNIYI